MNLDSHWINLTCPRCSYIADVQIVSVRLGETIICHNCKLNIKLQDETASVHTGIRSVERAWSDLLNTFEKFN
ncbi:hypothetical protein GCM10028807_36420 [Spirosoma daeguense]